MNYYFVLGVSPDATTNEVRQAYLALAKKYHPDKNKSPEATSRMAEINLAYETLCDSQKRQEYNLEKGIVVEEVVEQYSEEEEIGQDEPSMFGRCVKCNFVNSSGIFVCSVCGYAFDLRDKNGRKAERYDNYDEITAEDFEEVQDNMSEIIRCPQCNEINMYSRGSCWQCGLDFVIEEAT